MISKHLSLQPVQWSALKNNSLGSVTHPYLFFYPSFLLGAEKKRGMSDRH